MSERIGADNVLAKIDALVDWRALSLILKRGLGRSGDGPPGYDPLILFKCLLIGQWHGLSDPKLERALKVRLDFMIFCGLDLHAPVPDETTHCRFRNALVKGGVYDDLLVEVCAQIQAHGLKLKEVEAAIIDATLVESAARPRTHIEAPQDRAEDEASGAPDVHFSADPDARWVKKGSKSTLGYKAFARADEEGFIDKVRATPANRAESPEFGCMIEGARARWVLADKAYASKANRERLRGKHPPGSCARPQGRTEPPAARLREEVQQADLKTPLPGRANFRHDETPLRSAPRPLFSGAPKCTPNRRWPRSGRTCSTPQTRSPSTRKPLQSHNPTSSRTAPAETSAGQQTCDAQSVCKKSDLHAEVFFWRKTVGALPPRALRAPPGVLLAR